MEKSKKRRFFEFAVSIIVIVFLFVFFRSKSNFVFQTNDDVFLNSIVSGQVTGTPEAHMYHVGYPVGWMLSKLFCFFPKVPWYGLFLCFCIGITMTIVLHRILEATSEIWKQAVVTGIFALAAYSFLFYHVASLQFTFATACLGAGGLALFILWEETETPRKNIYEIFSMTLLCFLACSIRADAFYMLFPFFGLYGLEKLVLAIRNKGNKYCRVLTCGICILSAVLVSYGINRLAYSSDEWKDFTRFNTARAKVMDYAGFPQYEENEELYDSLGISRSSYEMLAHYYGILLEPELSTASMERIAEVSREQNSFVSKGVLPKAKSMVCNFGERHLNYADRPLNLLVYALYFLFFVLALIGGKKHAIVDILLCVGARMVVWIYLLFIDRYPIRVTQGIYVTELCVLLAISLKHKLWQGRIRNKAVLCSWGVSLILICLICVRFGIPKARAIGYESKGRYLYSKAFEEMKDYFEEHSDNFYYLDMNSFTHFTQDALQGGREKNANYIYTGSWLPKSPLYDEKLEREDIENALDALCRDSDVYIVFMDSVGTGYDYLEKYCRDKYGELTFTVADQVVTSNGLKFQILEVVK